MADKKWQKVAAGWKKTTQSGVDIISISVTADIAAGTKLTAWPNDKGDNPKRPDFNLVIDDYKKPEPVADKPVPDDGIPF